jgi:hypothetical protein
MKPSKLGRAIDLRPSTFAESPIDGDADPNLRYNFCRDYLELIVTHGPDGAFILG